MKKKRIIELLASELASDDLGIYPMAIVDGSGKRKERTEWQDGWNAYCMEQTKKLSVIEAYLLELPKRILKQITKERIGLIVRDDKVILHVNCNDLFYWACADSEEFELSDINSFENALEDAKSHGGILWCCRKRGMRPQTPYYEYFTDEEKQLFDACGPERNDS